MRGPTVAISDIFRQTTIAFAALFSCPVSFTLTTMYFIQIDPGATRWLMVAIGVAQEVAKIAFALTGAKAWSDGQWVKSGIFWSLSVTLSIGSIMAAHGVVIASDTQGVMQRVEASPDYQALKKDADRLSDRLDFLVDSVKKDSERDRDTRAHLTEKRIDLLRPQHLEALKKLAAYRSRAVTSDDATGNSTAWHQLWCLIVTIMAEVIGQVAMAELMASSRMTPSALDRARGRLPVPESPEPETRRLHLVPARRKASLHDEAERLVKEGLPATHAALMEALLCSRSTAQRVLKRMRSNGVLRLSGNRNIRAA